MCVALQKISCCSGQTALKTEPVRRYGTMLRDQMTRIEGNLYSIQVDGKEKIVSFQFELLPNCGLPKNADAEKCNFCSDHLHKLVSDSVIQGKITNQAKAATK